MTGRSAGRRDERASATVELVWLGLLLLFPLVWLVVSVFDVQRGSFGVAAAARAAGRAYALWGLTYANGSNDSMGLWNIYVSTTLKQTAPNYYVIGSCP